MILNSRVPTKLIPRADFKPEQFRKVIHSHGMDVQWEQAAECPCSNPAGTYGFSVSQNISGHSEQNRNDCPACHGKGYLYHSKQTIRAVVTGIRKEDERHSAQGATEYSKGQIGITLLPEHLPSMGDRFTILSSAIVFRETIERGSTTTDKLRYKAKSRSHDLATGNLDFGVRYLIYADSNGVVDPNNTLLEGSAFQIDADGQIEWIDPAQTPAQGQRYSVEYYASPAYIVNSHPHVIRDTQIKLKSPAPYHAELPVYAEAQLEFYGIPEGSR